MYKPVLCPGCIEYNSKSRVYLKGTRITYRGIKTCYDQNGVLHGYTEYYKPTTHVHDLIIENGEWCCTYNHKGTYIKYEKCKILDCEFSIGPRIDFTIN